MRYEDAKMLRVGDEIIIKRTGERKIIVEVDIHPKTIWLVAVNDCHYTHREVQKE